MFIKVINIIIISIHVPREGDDSEIKSSVKNTAISIHVPREGDDQEASERINELATISIHVPREGDD